MGIYPDPSFVTDPVDLIDSPLRNRLKALAVQYPRYGYPMLHELLKAEGLVRNRKKTYRLYCEETLQGRTKRRKKLKRPRVPMMLPDKINERWSMALVSDQLANGRPFRVLNIVDDCSRQCAGQLVDASISGQRVTRFLDELAERRGLPKVIVCDNGPRFTSKALFFRSRETGVKPHFFQPGKPTQNAFVESFNGKFRDQRLNLYRFRDLATARRTIEDRPVHYHEVRPHRSLNDQRPAMFAKQAA